MDKDIELFREQLLNIQESLYSFAYMLTADKEEAKDLVQDTTLKVLNNYNKYFNDINFKGWVFTIMRNIFINNHHRFVRSQTIVDNTETLYHLNLPQESGIETPDGNYTISEIYRIISMFSEDYQIPFSMHIAGYKYSEIASFLKLPIGTIKSRIFYARKKLQVVLKDYR